VDQPLLAAIRMRHVVDQLDVKHLVETVVCDGLVSPENRPAIRCDKRGFLTELLLLLANRQRVERRIEDIENQSPIFSQVLVGGCKAGELFFDCNQVLKGPERNHDQFEGSPEIEVPHVRLDELRSRLNRGALLPQLVLADGQHLRRQIESHDFSTGASDRDQDATRAATNLENGTAGVLRGIHEERDIRSLAVRNDPVVEVGHERVRIVTAG
jgi:hypothetical protein